MIVPSPSRDTGLSINVFETGHDLLNECEEWLYRSEACNNGLLSIAALTESKESLFVPPFWYASIRDQNKVIGCAIYAMPDGLCVSEVSETAAHVLVAEFMKTGLDAQRIAGPDHASRLVAKALALQTKTSFMENVHWQSYITDAPVKPDEMPPGKLRLATDADRDLVVDFGQHYGDEKPVVVDVSSYFLRKLKDDMLWAWDDNGVKTLIAMSGRTRNGIRVAGVFTPVEHRRLGYASAAVWTVTEHYMADGCKFCILLVDKSDPHVMLVYEKIGYSKTDSRLEMRRELSDIPVCPI